MSAAHGETFNRGERLVIRAGEARAALIRSMGMVPPQDEVPVGRFGRIFENLPVYEPTNAGIRELAETMREGEDESNDSAIPLGFAFLGQFIDHDITLDPVSRLDDRLDPEAVRNFRTPAVDLDNVYGEGPDASRHLYDTAGKNMSSEHRLPFRLLTGTAKNCDDLPRNRQGTALIGDPRNDENLLVSQIHHGFLAFHNQVVMHLEEEHKDNPLGNKDTFDEARKLATLHYHWVVLHEFLPHIVGSDVVMDIINNGRTHFKWEERSSRPYIPVEFSGAAYRFGHTLIRAEYNLNATKQGIKLFDLPFFGLCPNEDCGAEPGPSADYNLDFAYFFDTGTPDLQFCRKIDAKIAEPLFDLPFIHAGQDAPVSLPERNMRRGRTLKLPSGQDVAQAMGIAPLSNQDLGIANIQGLDGKAPLWFYILKEAALTENGEHLGPVGGRIVAETLVAMVDVVRQSYLSPAELATWRPTLPTQAGTTGTFTMSDLLAFRAVPAMA